ncbi:acyl-CoA thioesterase [Abditibacterium utsteinense]|nr:thioesterase family protein [Abditibacterium utsteinense]
MKISLPILVVAFETDFGGVVSNVRYLEYIERARYALWHAAGLQVEKTWREFGVQAVVRRVEVDYLGFARHEDELEMEIEIAEIGGATLVLSYELSRPADGAILLRARQTMAFLNTKWRPVRVPKVFRAALALDALGSPTS